MWWFVANPEPRSFTSAALNLLCEISKWNSFVCSFKALARTFPVPQAAGEPKALNEISNTFKVWFSARLLQKDFAPFDRMLFQCKSSFLKLAVTRIYLPTFITPYSVILFLAKFRSSTVSLYFKADQSLPTRRSPSLFPSKFNTLIEHAGSSRYSHNRSMHWSPILLSARFILFTHHGCMFFKICSPPCSVRRLSLTSKVPNFLIC